MAAILDKQTGKRYGQTQFVNEVVDLIRSDDGRAPCYELLESLKAKREGRSPTVVSITVGDVQGVPSHLRGRSYELVEGGSDVEGFEREWRGATPRPNR